MKTFLRISTLLSLALCLAVPTLAATFEFHGDLNNRFGLYTDQIGFFTADSTDTAGQHTAVLDPNDRKDTFASIKYRLWMEAATNDGNVKGVYAIELGAVRFGRTGGGKGQGGSFSGDGVNIETRWAYTDFQIPGAAGKSRVAIGLQPFQVNKFFWAETAMGVKYTADDFYLAWMRGKEALTGSGEDWGDNDVDSLTARYDMKQGETKAGFFLSYLWEDINAASTDFSSFDPIASYGVKNLPDSTFDLLAVGTDGSTRFGDFFVNWDAIYESGTIDGVNDGINPVRDLDLSAYLLHADIGYEFGRNTITYTVWYASGDDNPNDTDLDAFISVDVDLTDSIIFMEGGYTDDVYFTERPYIGDKGLFLNKIAFDHKASEKLSMGLALLYLETAEDLIPSESALGVEVDGYVSYMIYPNVEFAVNAGFLAADDAMDFFEVTQNGKSDVDIFLSTARVRYKF